MSFLPWQLAAAYGMDLLLGDPPGFPHPVRWIGHLIMRVEDLCYHDAGRPAPQLVLGMVFWLLVMAVVALSTWAALWIGSALHAMVGFLVAVWLAYTSLATRSLHHESLRVARALKAGDLPLARQQLARLVSRETSDLNEEQVIRALLETVSENISDGVVAPLFYLALGGPIGAMLYKAVNTMDSMVGYRNDRYRYFGFWAAKADDAANWIPARLTGLLLVGSAWFLGFDWQNGWKTMGRDGRKPKSPNAGIPEAAAAGALGVRLGGASIYFGRVEDKPYLGDPLKALSLEDYRHMIRLLYGTSLAAFLLAFWVRALISVSLE